MSYIDPGDPDRWDRAIDFLTRSGGQAIAYIPIIEAVRAGVMNLQFASNRTAALPMSRIRRCEQPVMILLSEDDYQPGGPQEWRIAEQVTRWCRGALIHGAGAERQHYERAVLGTMICKRFLVVDTASRYVGPWMTLLGHVQALAIVPRDGQHPIVEKPGVLH